MDTELGKKAKNDFEKDYFELMNNAVSRETMKNVRNHRDFKLITKGARRNLLAIEMEKKHTHACACAHTHTHTHTHIFMNKQVYVGLAILDLSKIVMYEFWYDYVKPKYGESKIMLHEFKQLCNQHKSRQHLHRYCKRCRNKI